MKNLKISHQSKRTSLSIKRKNVILHNINKIKGSVREAHPSPRRKLGSKGVSRPLPLNTEIMLIIVYVVSILHSYPRHSSWEQFRSEECISPINMRGLTHL